MAEEIARARSDLPYTGDSGDRVEDARVRENLGEFPDLGDQGGEDAVKR